MIWYRTAFYVSKNVQFFIWNKTDIVTRKYSLY